MPLSTDKKPEITKEDTDTNILATKPGKNQIDPQEFGGHIEAIKSTNSFSSVTNELVKRFNNGIVVEFMKTGSFGFDKVCGGGLPRGRISVLQSATGLGKTTIALHFVRSICSSGGKVLFLDSESALNDSLVEGVGLTEQLGSNFIPYKIQTFSEVEEVLDAYSSKEMYFDLIVLDSMTALSSTKLQKGDMKIEDIEPGWQSRLQSIFFLKYKGLLPKWGRGTHLLLISQERVHLNFRGMSSVKGAGGKPMEFYPDLRLVVSKKQDIFDSEKRKIGTDLSVEAAKNKFTMPFAPSSVSVLFGRGISNIRACTFLLEDEGVVKQSGSCFVIKLGDIQTSVKGRIGLENFIRTNEPKVLEYLKSKGLI